MLPPSHHKNPDGISQSLHKQIPPNDNHGEPQMLFSIRQYALSCRQNDIFSNWPFPEKYLHICLERGISDVLPPLESHNSAIRSLRGAVDLNCRQRDDDNFLENKEPADTIEQEIEVDTIEQEIEGETIEQEIEDHTIEQEIEDHTMEQEIEEHTIEQETEDQTIEQETEDQTIELEIEHHTIEQEIEDECKLYSESKEAISELSIQQCHVSSSSSSLKHEENKTDFSPRVASDVIVSTDQPSTTIPSSHVNVGQCDRKLASYQKPRHMKKRHKNKLKKRSMENVLSVAKHCTSEDLLRIKRLCCVFEHTS